VLVFLKKSSIVICFYLFIYFLIFGVGVGVGGFNFQKKKFVLKWSCSSSSHLGVGCQGNAFVVLLHSKSDLMFLTD
jgi:hypothetical protein